MIICPECGILEDTEVDEYGDCMVCGNPTYEENENDDD
jgi:hypothetical protein